MPATIELAVIVVTTSVLAALAALLVLPTPAALHRRGARADAHVGDSATGAALLVFDDRRLVDSNADGQRLADTARSAHSAGLNPAAGGDDLAPVLQALSTRFPDLLQELSQLAARGRVEMVATDGSGFALTAQWRGGLAHLSITDTRSERSSLLIDRLSYEALQAELRSLRSALGRAPILIWRETASGAVIWANSAYLDLAVQGPGLTGWPLPRLFALPPAEPGVPRGARPLRQQIEGPAATPARWFERTRLPDGDGSLNYALPADSIAQSEQARRDLVQTLAGAFATHAAGLAVFDEERRLQIFNPALGDMTGLSAQFLAARPSFDQVLHALRERRMLPEPADYRSWRSALLAMERAALSGAYHEEWHLPAGQVLHVTGRPHPGGGIAFLFEDVTDEITLTRSFRAQIDTGQAVIDTLPEAMAVFSALGTLTLANAAYHRLWGTDPADVGGHATLRGALEDWRAASHAGPIWFGLGRIGEGNGPLEPMSGSVALRNGQVLAVRTARLEGGNTLVIFGNATGNAQFPSGPGQGAAPHTELLLRTDREDRRAAGIVAAHGGSIPVQDDHIPDHGRRLSS